jgi:hypothetical protein
MSFFNFIVITVASIAVVGFMELLKNFLPENINGKILTGVSLALSIAAGVGFCFAFGVTGVLPILVNTAAVIGLVQTSYNFVLKLILQIIEKIKAQIEEEVGE